jgi:tetratricopeptide (TPR) repeat protein
MDILNNPDRALELLTKAVEIDPDYDWAQALLGNYYAQMARQTDDPESRAELFQKSIKHYRKAIEITKSLNYYFVLASVYQMMNDLNGLVAVLDESLNYVESNNDIWKIEENLAIALLQLGKSQEALQHAKNALKVAPESEIERLENLIDQINATP